MQDLTLVAAVLREISFGIFLAGLFYTFGMFALGRLFAIFGNHDVDHDLDHDIDHDYDHDIDHGVEHEYDYDYDIGHSYDHELDHDVDHDVDYDHDLDHDVDHDLDHDVDHHPDHDYDHDTGHDVDHSMELHHGETPSGFFEFERGPPLGVTIGTSLVSFGLFGSVIYYPGIILPFIAKVFIHLFSSIVMVMFFRIILGKFMVESGFRIEPRHIVGRRVEAVSTIWSEFGEVRSDTEMGLRRFQARPLQSGETYQKGEWLFVVSANEKVVFVDASEEITKGQQMQSKKPREE